MQQRATARVRTSMTPFVYRPRKGEDCESNSRTCHKPKDDPTQSRPTSAAASLVTLGAILLLDIRCAALSGKPAAVDSDIGRLGDRLLTVQGCDMTSLSHDLGPSSDRAHQYIVKPGSLMYSWSAVT